MVILELIERLKYPHSVSIPMHPRVGLYHVLDIIWLKVGVPKVELEFLSVGIF